MFADPTKPAVTTPVVEPIDLAAAITPPEVVQVPGNEPTLTPNPVIPESAPPNPLVSPESPVVIGPSTSVIEPITTAPAPITQQLSPAIPTTPGFPAIDPVDLTTGEKVPLPPLTGQFASPEVPTPVNTVQPLQVTPGLADPNITFSQIEPGLKWAIANGLVSVDAVVSAYGEHLRVLLEGI
jgi:hypothetical protein